MNTRDGVFCISMILMGFAGCVFTIVGFMFLALHTLDEPGNERAAAPYLLTIGIIMTILDISLCCYLEQTGQCQLSTTSSHGHHHCCDSAPNYMFEAAQREGYMESPPTGPAYIVPGNQGPAYVPNQPAAQFQQPLGEGYPPGGQVPPIQGQYNPHEGQYSPPQEPLEGSMERMPLLQGPFYHTDEKYPLPNTRKYFPQEQGTNAQAVINSPHLQLPQEQGQHTASVGQCAQTESRNALEDKDQPQRGHNDHSEYQHPQDEFDSFVGQCPPSLGPNDA